MRAINLMAASVFLLLCGCFFAGAVSAFRHASYSGAGLLAAFGCVYFVCGVYLIKRSEGE